MNTIENLKAEKEIWIKVKRALSSTDYFMCNIIRRLTKEPLRSHILIRMNENRPDDTRKNQYGEFLNVWWPTYDIQYIQKRKDFCSKMISLCEKEISEQSQDLRIYRWMRWMVECDNSSTRKNSFYK